MLAIFVIFVDLKCVDPETHKEDMMPEDARTDEEIEREVEEFQKKLEAGEVVVPPLTPEEEETERHKLLVALAHHADVVFRRLGLSDVVDELVERMKRK